MANHFNYDIFELSFSGDQDTTTDMDVQPVLFLCFNRPEETAQSFQCIRSAKPSKLYVSIDGPRNGEEKTRCHDVENIVRKIDWNCDAKFLIHNENKGCKQAVNTALDWFFENEEMGIILEDDIVVKIEFFEFLSICLEKYKSDTRIMLVTGNNILGEFECDSSYFFSRIGAIWGWATWRRAWSLHDKHLKAWPKIKSEKGLENILPTEMAAYREKVTDAAFSGEIDTWDYQFTFTRLIQSGLAIVPSINMVKNIGFSENATHTLAKPKHFDNVIRDFKIESLKEPSEVYANANFDLLTFNAQRGNLNFKQRIYKKLKG